MNRRELLLALAASACSGAPIARPENTAKRTPTGPSYPTHYATTTLEPSPLSIHGDVLVHRTPRGKLLWWDTFVMDLVGETTVQDAAAATFLADDILAVLADDVLHRVTRDRTLGAYAVRPSVWRRSPVLLRAASAESVYLLDDDELVLVRFTAASLEEVTRLPFPGRHGPDRGQAFSLDDGRVVTHGDGLVVLTPGAAMRSYPTARLTKHLARATGERLWYSYADAAWGLHRLALAPITEPSKEIVTLDLAPARIVHLASHASAVALVLVTKDARWFVAVVDESGRERWRVELPAKQTRGFDLAAVVAIAMTPHRVILRGLDEELLAWDASNGGMIPV